MTRRRRVFFVGLLVTLLGGVAVTFIAFTARPKKPPSTVKNWNRAPTVFTATDKAWATKALKHLALGGYNDGDVVHNANEILGLIALQDGRVADAKAYLLKAGATTGSPALGSFGPSMLLARRLVEHGERTVVLQYLDQVEKFWAKPPGYYARRAAKFWAEPRNSVKDKLSVASPDDIKRGEELSREHARQLAEWRVLVRRGEVPRDWLWNLDPPQR